MAKIYLSAAAHAADRITDCGIADGCSENTHCRKYVDLLEKRLIELGFFVRRNFLDETGDNAMKHRVEDSNEWDSNYYYIAHTNAGGGKYSMTMCYPDEVSRTVANVFHNYRKSAYSGNHKVVENSELYEIKNTKCISIYDELYFHDDPEMNRWFHTTGMVEMVEETCRAFCHLTGTDYAISGEKMYKVQVGAFKNSDYAYLLRDELIANGYDAFVKYE